ncbi:MAG: DnaJ domain-containing protein, partial [Alkalispirochaeta sp.]
PYRERRWEYVEAWGTAALLIGVLRADGPPRVAQVERALSESWPTTASSGRHRGFSRRSLIDLGLREHPRINRPGILEMLARWDEPRKDQLLELLVAVACADTEGMSSAELAVIRSVADSLARPVPQWDGLDRNACTLLGIPTNADETAVRRAFRALAAELHPDTGGDLNPEQRRTMEDAFVRVRHAHDRLLAQLRERDHPLREQ